MNTSYMSVASKNIYMLQWYMYMYVCISSWCIHVYTCFWNACYRVAPLFSTGYGPPKGGNPYLSPADSAIGSGVPSGVASSVQSGVQTKAHSEVAPGDLEQFDGDDGAPQQPFGKSNHLLYTLSMFA